MICDDAAGEREEGRGGGWWWEGDTGRVSGGCFTSLNFVCLRSQYVGAVNSKLSAVLSGFGVARFCNRGFNDLPADLPPSRNATRPLPLPAFAGVNEEKLCRILIL